MSFLIPYPCWSLVLPTNVNSLQYPMDTLPEPGKVKSWRWWEEKFFPHHHYHLYPKDTIPTVWGGSGGGGKFSGPSEGSSRREHEPPYEPTPEGWVKKFLLHHLPYSLDYEIPDKRIGEMMEEKFFLSIISSKTIYPWKGCYHTDSV